MVDRVVKRAPREQCGSPVASPFTAELDGSGQVTAPEEPPHVHTQVALVETGAMKRRREIEEKRGMMGGGME